MKWGNKYPADYVNRLYSMVARNMQRRPTGTDKLYLFKPVESRQDPDRRERLVELRPARYLDDSGVDERCA